MDSVSPSNRGAGDSNELSDFEFNDTIKNLKSKQQKGQRGKEGKSKDLKSPVNGSMLSGDSAANGSTARVVRSSMEASSGHGFEVGDMVWGKVKSHPWWPGHVYSEQLATPAVRRSKREGLLLVAFFGDSSYGWFHPSELIPFDSNFEDKSRQTNSKTFVKAVEEAVDEVSRRAGLGLSCMCRNKKNLRETDVKGFLAVDVDDYDPGAVYSVDTIGKARDDFQPGSALDFVRQLALEPTGSEDAGIDFIKNKATVMSYRKAVYEEVDDTYAQAFGHQPVSPSPGSVAESIPRKTLSKAPLSGRQVFADTLAKAKTPAKPNKPNDQAKKDKYIFKRRDEPKDIKTHPKEKAKVTSSPQPAHFADPVAIDAGDYVLQKRGTGTLEETDTPIVQELGFEMNSSKVESPNPSSAGEVKPVNEAGIVPETDDRKTSSVLIDDKSSRDAKIETQDGTPDSEPDKKVAIRKADSGPEKIKVSKRPVGDLGSGKSSPLDKKKKRKKEYLMSDGARKVSSNKPVQPVLDPKPTDNKSHTAGTRETTELENNEADITRVLGDLHSLALDPFHALNRRPVKVRRAFLRFRSLVFQKSLNLSEDEANDTRSSGPENDVRALPPVKPLARPSGRLDDPIKGGLKRGPSDRQEEIAAKKKKKVGDIRNLTEKKVMKKVEDPPARDVKQAPEPTMLMMKFPNGGYLPSVNELKARFARYGPMDHSATRVFWNTFTCRVLYRHKADAKAAFRFVVGSSSLFGNTDVKCCLKMVGAVGPELEPSPRDRQPAVLPGAPGVQLKSCLKKSGVEETGGRGMAPRVKFLLGGDEKSNGSSVGDGGAGGSSFSSSSSSHATLDFNSKNFGNESTSVTTQFTPPLPPLPPPSLGGAPPLPPANNLHKPVSAPLVAQKVDISQQMLSLLRKCNDIVTNVTDLLGYVPFHPL